MLVKLASNIQRSTHEDIQGKSQSPLEVKHELNVSYSKQMLC